MAGGPGRAGKTNDPRAEAYRRAGVDLDAAARAVDLIGDLAAEASRPEMMTGAGGYAGLWRLGDGRLLAASTDGVGTKVDVARRAGRLGTVGIDVVAMSVNDVLCTGAEPLFFLDYLAVGRLVPEVVAGIVSGVAEGCRRAGCALLGGETAEHPGLLEEGEFDLAGFCVGIVAEDRLLDPQKVREGDAIVGLPSNGLHANGFSLVRKVLDESGLDLGEIPEGLSRPLADELLEPTAIYAGRVLRAEHSGVVRSAAHITGGGLVENVPRALPEGLGADLERDAWEVPPIFGVVQRLAGASDEEMRRTFNLGLGMVLAVLSDAAHQVAEEIGGSVVGRVIGSPGVRFR